MQLFTICRILFAQTDNKPENYILAAKSLKLNSFSILVLSQPLCSTMQPLSSAFIQFTCHNISNFNVKFKPCLTTAFFILPSTIKTSIHLYGHKQHDDLTLESLVCTLSLVWPRSNKMLIMHNKAMCQQQRYSKA